MTVCSGQCSLQVFYYAGVAYERAETADDYSKQHINTAL